MFPIYPACTIRQIRHIRRRSVSQPVLQTVHIPYCHERKEFQLNLVPEAITRRIPLELFRARIEQLNAIVIQNTPHPILRYVTYSIPFLMVAPILVFAHSGFGTVSSIVSVLLLVSLFVPLVVCPLQIHKAYWKCTEELCSAFIDFTRIDSSPPRALEWHLAYPTAFDRYASMFPKQLELTIELSFPSLDITQTTTTTTAEMVSDHTPLALLPFSPPPPPYTDVSDPKPGALASPLLLAGQAPAILMTPEAANAGLVPLTKPADCDVGDSGAVLAPPTLEREAMGWGTVPRPRGGDVLGNGVHVNGGEGGEKGGK